MPVRAVVDDLPPRRPVARARRPARGTEHDIALGDVRPGIGGQAGQRQLDRASDLDRREGRQRPQARPVVRRHRHADPVPGPEPPPGRHQLELDVGLARAGHVDRAARHGLGLAGGRDVVQLDRHDRARARDGRCASARAARRARRPGSARGCALEAGAARLVDALVAEEAAVGRRRAPVAGATPTAAVAGRRLPARPASASSNRSRPARRRSRSTSPDTRSGAAAGESCSSMKTTDRGRRTAAADPGSRWARKNAISSRMNGYLGARLAAVGGDVRPRPGQQLPRRCAAAAPSAGRRCGSRRASPRR